MLFYFSYCFKMSSSLETSSNSLRKALSTTVCSVLQEVGFLTAEKAVVETLTEMLQSCLTEIARSSRSFCELTGRTEPVVGDVIIALVEMGLPVDTLSAYAKRPVRSTLPTPTLTPKPFTPKILQAGEKKSLPNYIPENYPPFPDPHAYIRTPTHKQPVTEYEAIREKAASQKRDVERALTRFVAKTGATQSLFADDNSLFPLIACKSMAHPYLNALLPKDQIFDEDEDNSQCESKKEKDGAEAQEAAKLDTTNDNDVMDNPFLRPVKMPRKRRR